MLQAGAERVFYIQAYENVIECAFQKFLESIGKDALIICESRNLRNYVRPGIYILMIRETETGFQKDMTIHLPMANLACRGGNDPVQMQRIVSRISIQQNSWKLD